MVPVGRTNSLAQSLCPKTDSNVAYVMYISFHYYYYRKLELILYCTSCQKWVHRKCSGIKGSMYKVMKSFICRGCMNPVTGTGCTRVDTGGDANLELVDKVCYLSDVFSVDRDADAAVETRIRIGWNKFRQLVLLLNNKNISLIVRGRLYSSCVQNRMLY